MTREDALSPTTSPRDLQILSRAFPKEVAQNPNACFDTILDLSFRYPESVEKNPVLPLWAVEDPERHVSLQRYLGMGWIRKLSENAEGTLSLAARAWVTAHVLAQGFSMLRPYCPPYLPSLPIEQGELQIQSFADLLSSKNGSSFWGEVEQLIGEQREALSQQDRRIEIVLAFLSACRGEFQSAVRDAIGVYAELRTGDVFPIHELAWVGNLVRQKWEEEIHDGSAATRVA